MSDPELLMHLHIQLTELAIDLDEGKFSAVTKRVTLEVAPYLTDAHALESTGTPSATTSPTPDSGRLTLRV